MSEWVVPCNTKNFDIFSHFESCNTVAFKRVGMMCKDDVAFIYLSAPYSEIRFRCIVVNDQMSDKELEEHPYAIDKFSAQRYVLLKLDGVFQQGCLPLAKLKVNGLGQVQRQSRVDRKLLSYIEREGILEHA